MLYIRQLSYKTQRYDDTGEGAERLEPGWLGFKSCLSCVQFSSSQKSLRLHFPTWKVLRRACPSSTTGPSGELSRTFLLYLEPPCPASLVNCAQGPSRAGLHMPALISLNPLSTKPFSTALGVLRCSTNRKIRCTWSWLWQDNMQKSTFFNSHFLYFQVISCFLGNKGLHFVRISAITDFQVEIAWKPEQSIHQEPHPKTLIQEYRVIHLKKKSSVVLSTWFTSDHLCREIITHF